MREFETVFVTQPNLPEAQHKHFVDRLTAVVEKQSGKLFYAQNMGNRTLAYPIKKQTKGLYTCLDYTAKGEAVAEIERQLRLDENVLRFLTVVKNDDVDVAARTQEILARGEGTAQEVSEHEVAAPAYGAGRNHDYKRDNKNDDEEEK